jgi:hypothetical protein
MVDRILLKWQKVKTLTIRSRDFNLLHSLPTSDRAFATPTVPVNRMASMVGFKGEERS